MKTNSIKKKLIFIICLLLVSTLLMLGNVYSDEHFQEVNVEVNAAEEEIKEKNIEEDERNIEEDDEDDYEDDEKIEENLIEDNAENEEENKHKYFIMVVRKNTNNNEEQDEDEKDKKIYTYSEDDVIAIAKTLYGECRGTKYKTIQSGVAWCILNRYDTGRYGKTITDVVSRRKGNDFLGYDKDNPVRKELYDLAKDVLDRWVREKNGEKNVGRTLPKEYKYFRDFYDGNKNIFFKTWNKAPTLKQLKKVTEIWRWEWENPYGETLYIKY